MLKYFTRLRWFALMFLSLYENFRLDQKFSYETIINSFC